MSKGFDFEMEECNYLERVASVYAVYVCYVCFRFGYKALKSALFSEKEEVKEE